MRFLGDSLGDRGIVAGKIMVEILTTDDGELVNMEVCVKPAGQRRWEAPHPVFQEQEQHAES